MTATTHRKHGRSPTPLESKSDEEPNYQEFATRLIKANGRPLGEVLKAVPFMFESKIADDDLGVLFTRYYNTCRTFRGFNPKQTTDVIALAGVLCLSSLTETQQDQLGLLLPRLKKLTRLLPRDIRAERTIVRSWWEVWNDKQDANTITKSSLFLHSLQSSQLPNQDYDGLKRPDIIGQFFKDDLEIYFGEIAGIDVHDKCKIATDLIRIAIWARKSADRILYLYGVKVPLLGLHVIGREITFYKFSWSGNILIMCMVGQMLFPTCLKEMECIATKTLKVPLLYRTQPMQDATFRFPNDNKFRSRDRKQNMFPILWLGCRGEATCTVWPLNRQLSVIN
ncbi:hypothetical protein EDD11_007326 [Mortierella claussenii]|nr:hypothetical protein EDD11_007326 [Mortierella claussenii]